MRIVYVEDNLPNQSLIERVAHSGNYQVIMRPTAEDALHHMEDDQPDLLLVDVALPGPMDGLTLVRHIRAAGIEMPIVAITAVADAEQCLAAGCDHYLVKPVAIPDVVAVLQRYTA